MEHRFIDNNDGTITDNLTGLMWQKDTASGMCNWQDAIHYCKNLELAGHDGWRLPNIQELQSIVDYDRYNPAINPIFGAKSSYYWSSSTSVYNTNDAWNVNFGGGNVNSDDKAYAGHVRAVRGRP